MSLPVAIMADTTTPPPTNFVYHYDLPAWVYGVGAFVVFLVALFIVTRLNADR